jgi:hypothetical protein
MRALLRVALTASLFGTSCLAQTGTGTVAFYSQGLSWKSEAASTLPYSHQPFDGRLFDGTQELAAFRHGRFAVFHVDSGSHSFILRGPEGADSDPFAINIEDGSRRCIRLFSKMSNLAGIYLEKNYIEEVPCQQAQREAAHLKPIEAKRVPAPARTRLDPATSFPNESPETKP